MLEIYREFAENVLAMPVLMGRKTDKEKFAGAARDLRHGGHDARRQGPAGRHLATTSATTSPRPSTSSSSDKDGKLKYVHGRPRWGVSTRLIGAIIMTHGDDRGLVLPPRVAPIQAVILPIAAHKGGVLEKAPGDRTPAEGRRASA